MDVERRIETLEQELRAMKGRTAIAIGIGLSGLVLAAIQLMSKGL